MAGVVDFVAFAILSSLSTCACGTRLSAAQALQEMDANEWWPCTRLLSTAMPLKEYKFEATIRGFGDGDVHAAIELIRDPLEPTLQIYVNHTWAIIPSPTNMTQMFWVPVDMEAKDPRDGIAKEPTHKLRLSSDMKFAHYSSTPEEVRFSFQDGLTFTLIDNKYFPKVLYEREFTRRMEKLKASHNDVLPNQGAFGNMQAEATRLGAIAQRNSGIDILTNPLQAGFNKSAEFMDKAAWKANEVTAAQKNFHKVRLLQEGAPLMMFGMFPLTLGVGLFAAAGSITLPVTLPYTLIGASFIGGSVHPFIKYKRETNITGNQKLFEKFRCHPQLKRCSRNTIVPSFEDCPSD